MKHFLLYLLPVILLMYLSILLIYYLEKSFLISQIKHFPDLLGKIITMQITFKKFNFPNNFKK